MRLGVVATAVMMGGFACTSFGKPSLTQAEIAASAARVDAALQRELAAQMTPKLNPWKLAVPATAPLDEAALFRRLCIDLAGRLPTAREAREYVADSAPADVKRARAIDRLLQETAAGDWRFQRMAEPLRVKDAVLGVSQQAYIQWLRKAWQQDMPYDELMRQLVSARGTLAQNPTAGFLLRDYGHVEITSAELARAFLGADIHCAGCHDHPFSDVTQREFYEFAACLNVVRPPADKGREDAAWFARLELGESALPLRLSRNYKYRDGKPGDVVSRRYLRVWGREEGDPIHALEARPSNDRLRDEVALWLTGRQNPRFSAVAAMRVWGWMFGTPEEGRPANLRGDPEEVDAPQAIWKNQGCGKAAKFDHYESWLEDRQDFVGALRIEFEACGCRLGEFQRILANTQAYQREMLSPVPVGPVPLLLPAPVFRRLPSEVVWDALVSWLPPQAQTDAWQTSLALPQVPAAEHPLRILGRGTREWADESQPAISHAVARLMIAAPIVDRITAPGSALLSSADVEQLFLGILGRRPSETEKASAAAFARSDPEDGLPGLAWALLNTKEFLFYR